MHTGALGKSGEVAVQEDRIEAYVGDVDECGSEDEEGLSDNVAVCLFCGARLLKSACFCRLDRFDRFCRFNYTAAFFPCCFVGRVDVLPLSAVSPSLKARSSLQSHE